MRVKDLLAACGLVVALAGAGPASAVTLLLSNQSFGAAGVAPQFSDVRNFAFEIDLAGTLVPGGVYDNASLVLVQYSVRGNLSQNPPTPSGFPMFFLNRTPSGEGPISPADWVGQGSSLGFEVATSANLADGLQLAELVADGDGLILELDGREFERLDRARYHPPQLLLFADGTGVLRNSNNSSGSTGTTNPATGEPVDVDFGDEYITNLSFDPAAITLVVPEPGTGLLVALGVLGLAYGRTIRKRGITPCPGSSSK